MQGIPADALASHYAEEDEENPSKAPKVDLPTSQIACGVIPGSLHSKSIKFSHYLWMTQKLLAAHNFNVVAGTLIIIAYLLINRVATKDLLIFIGTQVLLASFMFGNTVQTSFEGIIFMFVLHPFDVATSNG
ncbi:hypothetical protein ACS0TY_008941 [Phlomoides rotata]